MEREFVVKVILSRTDPDANDGQYIPLVVRAQTATAALNTFAQRSNATVVYALDRASVWWRQMVDDAPPLWRKRRPGPVPRRS